MSSRYSSCEPDAVQNLKRGPEIRRALGEMLADVPPCQRADGFTVAVEARNLQLRDTRFRSFRNDPRGGRCQFRMALTARPDFGLERLRLVLFFDRRLAAIGTLPLVSLIVGMTA